MKVGTDYIDKSERVRLKRQEQLRKINEFIDKRNAELKKYQRHDTAS